MQTDTLFFSDVAPACASDEGSACAITWKLTSSPWIAENSETLIELPLRILMIVVICLVIRGLINRMIKRVARSTTKGRVPTVLRPFRERVPNLMADSDSDELLGDRRKQRAETIGSVLRSLVSWMIYGIMFMLILAEFNVNLGPILASAGVVGLAIGFGAQALVKDIISGIFMIMEDQYGVGDIVDLGEVVGTVEVVGLRVTTVRDLQGALWYVRNGEIIRVANHSQSWANIVLDIPLALNTSLSKAQKAILSAAKELAEDPKWSGSILSEPEIQGVATMSPDMNSVRLAMRTTSDDQWAIGRDLRGRVMTALQQIGATRDLVGNKVFVSRTSIGEGGDET